MSSIPGYDNITPLRPLLCCDFKQMPVFHKVFLVASLINQMLDQPKPQIFMDHWINMIHICRVPCAFYFIQKDLFHRVVS